MYLCFYINYMIYKNWNEIFWNSIYLFIKSYPISNPTEVIKKKYYSFFSNLHYFIPNTVIKKQFEQIVNKYSIVPYLDTKLSLLQWTHFIHNKMSKMNGIDGMSLSKRQEHINKLFNPPLIKNIDTLKLSIDKKNIIHLIILFLLIYILFTFNI
jgi:hypothetical protein